MEAINYILAVLITYFSLFFGVILARLTKEELKPGKKYFEFVKSIFLIAIIGIALFISLINKQWIILGIIIFLSIILLVKKKRKENCIYILLGLIMFYSSNFINMFLLECSLIFIYGLITGTLIASRLLSKEKRFVMKKVFLRTLSYPIVTLLLFLITTFLF